MINMKKIIVLFFCIFLTFSCNNNAVEKPDNLISKDKMVDILYDISLLEAIKNQNINGGISSKSSNVYIYRKYKVDSVQLVKSNRYYASNLEEYKKMFDKVKEKLNKETLKVEGAMKKNGEQIPLNSNSVPNPDTPQVQ